MKALIFGAGGVGGVIAGFLAREGRDVQVVDPWFQNVETIKRQGLTVEAVEEEFTTEVRAHNLDELDDLGTFDIVVIACKSYDTTWIARLAREHLSSDTIVLSTQNGMNDLPIGAIVGQERVVGSVVTMACELVGAGHAKRATDIADVPLIFGEFGEASVSPRVKEVAQFFAPLGNVETVPDIWEERWGKLALNVMSNGLAGLTGRITNQLWSDPASVDVMIALGHEVALLASANGIHLAPVLKKISHEMLVQAVSTKTDEWSQIRDVWFTVAATRTGKRENTPSLLQDVQKHRRTEIDYLNGWVALRAEQRGVDALLNRAIVHAMRPVETGLQPPSPSNMEPLSDLVRAHYI